MNLENHVCQSQKCYLNIVEVGLVYVLAKAIMTFSE